MHSSANVSAFAARGIVGPKEPPLASENVAPREVSPEAPELSASVEDDDLSGFSVPEDENPFSVLNGKDTGPSPSAKRIFELGEDAIRVELSESQSIAVLGSYTIWVKSGEITILGARLQASPTLHKIFAPAIFALPPITAWSQKADFVLTSTDDGLHDILIDARRNIWDVPGQRTLSGRSFHIVGYSFQYNEVLRKHLKVLDLVQWRSTIATICKPLPEGRTVLVCGSGSTGKSTFCRTSTNQLLFDQASRTGIPDSKAGVLLLDLDLVQPELTPPGLIYLAHVTSALFGSPNSHHAIRGSSQSCILRMHYLGGINGDSVSGAGIHAIKDLFQYCGTVRKDYPGCPVLINSSSWLLDIEHAQVSSLISTVRPSDIVYFDSSGSLKYEEVLTRSMGDKCNLWCLASIVNRSAPTAILQWSQMQSYFHLLTPRREGPNWDPLALLSSNKRELPYSGPNSMIWAVITLGERLAPEVLAQALEDCIVAIVVVKKEDSGEAQGKQFRDERPKKPPGELAANVPDVLDEQQADHASIVRTGGENLPYFLKSDLEANFLRPRRSECLGLAYITAIDPVREIIEVATPIPQQIISAQSDNGLGLVLVMGRQDRCWAPAHR